MIKLGPLSEIDSALLRSWRNNPDIYKWCRQYEPLEEWDHEKWIKSLVGATDVKMYGVFDDEKIIGVCGLTSIDWVNRHAEFSLYIAPEHWGEGSGKRALLKLVKHGFEVLGLEHIFGETFDGNPAAEMFELVGFTKEGTRRRFYYREGRYIDAHLYSMLREEYDSKKLTLVKA